MLVLKEEYHEKKVKRFYHTVQYIPPVQGVDFAIDIYIFPILHQKARLFKLVSFYSM